MFCPQIMLKRQIEGLRKLHDRMLRRICDLEAAAMAEASFARAKKAKGNQMRGQGKVSQQGDVDGTNSSVGGGSLDGLELSTASGRQRNRRRRKRMMAGGASNKV